MNLTSKERVNFAMNLQKPDRIPLMCQFSIGSMVHQLRPNPVEFWLAYMVIPITGKIHGLRLHLEGKGSHLKAGSPMKNDNVLNKLNYDNKQQLFY